MLGQVEDRLWLFRSPIDAAPEQQHARVIALGERHSNHRFGRFVYVSKVKPAFGYSESGGV